MFSVKMDDIISDNDTICVPGMRLAPSKDFVGGPGTYERQGYYYAYVAGALKVENVGDGDDRKTIISIESPRTPTVVPKPGDVITAKVTMVNSRMVQCVIKCVHHTILNRSYRGVLKKEDIRATEKDRVDPYKCFRPGDIILARVLEDRIISSNLNGTTSETQPIQEMLKSVQIQLRNQLPITEIHWYHLTTAENELGVVIATADGSPPGTNMIPLSWIEMQCPVTLVKEPRKVAKVLPENVDHIPLLSKSKDDDKHET